MLPEVLPAIISPQSLAIGAAAVGLVGRESELLRFTLKNSFIMLFIICCITVVQAYLTPWVIPAYSMVENSAIKVVSNATKRYLYLLILIAIFFSVCQYISLTGKKSDNCLCKGQA
jgi:lactate permease